MIEPIKFLEKEEKIKPIKFLAEGEKVKPVSWIAVQEKDDGKMKGVKTDDSRLALHRIPKEVSDAEKYLIDMTQYLDGNIPHIVKPEKESSKIAEKEEKLANFKIKPVIRKIYYGRDGKEIFEKESIICQVYIENDYPKQLSVRVKEIDSLCRIIKKRFAKAYINCEITNAEKYIENEFRRNTASCKTQTFYIEAGWVKMSKGYIYVHDDTILGRDYYAETGLTLPSIQLKSNREIWEILKIAWGMYEDKVSMSVMLMYSFLGVLWKPFNEAGYPPHFALFLNGRTGSLKTSIGKILYTQLCEPEFRDSPRRIDSDTAVSLERAIVLKGKDTVTLIDDFSPAKTENKKRDMSDKLEMLIRMVGDGSSKSRSNSSLEDCRGEGVQGVVVLTGELMGKGVSSNLRCFYCKMQRESANLENISLFQNSPALYTTVIESFVKSIEVQWGRIVDYIRNRFEIGRKICSEVLVEKRLVDSATTLIVTSYIVKEFLQRWCSVSEEELKLIFEGIEEKIMQCALLSQSMSTEESPSRVFIKTLDNLERIGQIKIKNGKMLPSDLSVFDGFYVGDYLYLNPELVHKKVIQFLRQSNVFFPFDTREMEIMLAEDGISKTSSNGSGKKTLCARVKIGNERKYNFIKIPMEIYKKVIADEDFV